MESLDCIYCILTQSDNISTHKTQSTFQFAHILLYSMLNVAPSFHYSTIFMSLHVSLDLYFKI